MRTLHAHQLGCPCPSRVATDAHRCAGERLSARGLQGAAGTPPPTPSMGRVEADNPDTQGLVRLSGYPPRLPLPCGWRVDVAKRSWRLHVGPLFSDGGVSGPGALWPQGMRPSGVCGGSLHLPLGTHRAFRRASSITAPLRAGIPHPTQPRPCNPSRSAGSLARAGSQVSAHRLGPVSLHTRAANNGRQSPRGARLPA